MAAASRRSMFDGATLDDLRPPEWGRATPVQGNTAPVQFQYAPLELADQLVERVMALEAQSAEHQAEIAELHAENDWLRQENERVNHLLAFSGSMSFTSNSTEVGLDLLQRNIPMKVVFVPNDTNLDFPYSHYLHIVPLYEKDDRPEGDEPPAWWDRVLGKG